MAAKPNPDPSRITAAMWRLWSEFDVHHPKTQLGGIFAPKSGYHNTRNANVPGDYSRQFAADRRGPADKAAALDLTFPNAQGGDFSTIILYSRRLDAAAKARDPRLYVGRTPVLREFIGTIDGERPYAYDLQRRGSDHDRDDSHMWHIHLSVTRQFVTDWDILAGVLSVLIGDSIVAITKDDMKTMMQWDPGDDTGIPNWEWRGDFTANKTVRASFAWWLGPELAHAAKVEAAAARADVAKLAGELTELRKRVDGLPKTLAPALVKAVGQAIAEGIADDVLTNAIKEGVRDVLGSLDSDQLKPAEG
ncbi:hypothetical protein [Phytomonospora endophytica]|uniref:Uncharacterized protein n=1 Tax=Phytomonospora endophytica TaxID=714109 RepID=A0A841FM29_9ACTN|nr:hypothetical protein [Phytomonospora endophytica]MBB6034592.1 hypothetical protein [Phytomonospora endophytica]GIG71348.1 hypothetical protein Pen01_76430 [Phytomonospora endophytica]